MYFIYINYFEKFNIKTLDNIDIFNNQIYTNITPYIYSHFNF